MIKLKIFLLYCVLGLICFLPIIIGILPITIILLKGIHPNQDNTISMICYTAVMLSFIIPLILYLFFYLELLAINKLVINLIDKISDKITKLRIKNRTSFFNNLINH